MRDHLTRFAVTFVAAVAASLVATYLANNVTTIRRAVQ